MTTVKYRRITKKNDVMADMQEGHTNTNIPEFTEEANTCRFWFKTNPGKLAGSISI
jgi:hypothetical protein